jgi:pSer/pThr/pTyr-binding forkhead associated (FHA) protein
MNARLIPADGGPDVPFDKDLILVGRNEDCELRLDHKSVSKQHCILVKTDGLILVRDLGSTNGTRVNGQRVRRAALLPNDQFAVANFKYRVAFGVPAEPPVAVSDDTPSNLAKPNVIRRNELPDVIEKAPS